MSILVSICCITYNHEKYIADAIEGFLMQKTDFPIEIIIHDDASTDRTPEIIRSYHERYPDLIKSIYQSVNQYSQGIKIPPTFVWPRARGKYIALCEGDDYWTDPCKLQKQVDYMEAHPECSLCCHNAILVDVNKNSLNRAHVPYSIFNRAYYHGVSRKYTAGELVLLDFVPTASLLFPRSLVDELPSFYFKAIYGDLPLRLFLAHKGYAFYMDEIMSAYRKGDKRAITSILNSTRENVIKHYKGYLKILDDFNDYSNYLYDKEIRKAKLIRELGMLIYERDIKGLFRPEYKTILDTLRPAEKAKIYTKCISPTLYYFWGRLESRLGNIKESVRQISHATQTPDNKRS